MFKKTVVLSVVVALMVLGLFVDPSAAQTLTNVSKKGSLLVFPKINTLDTALDTTDTIIMMGNDSARDVLVKCYWMDSTQAAWDFEITLTKNQPIYFSAKTGRGVQGENGSDIPNEFGVGKVGELKCWAVKFAHDPPDDGDLEMLAQHNHLYGNALLIQTRPVVRAFEYNAWAFNLYVQPSSDESQNLDLNGAEYDRCPAYLIYNFFGEGGVADGAEFGKTTMTLSPCQQDLRQDKLPVCAKARYDIWNANEDKLTSAYQCVKCWFEGVLTNMGTPTDIWAGCDLWKLATGKCKLTGTRGTNFTAATLKTDNGRFRVSPDTFAACRGVFFKARSNQSRSRNGC